MDEEKYNQIVRKLGQLQEQLRQLTENDYATAMYKGYSTNGQTLEEVNESISTVEIQIEKLERRLEEDRNNF